MKTQTKIEYHFISKSPFKGNLEDTYTFVSFNNPINSYIL